MTRDYEPGWYTITVFTAQRMCLCIHNIVIHQWILHNVYGIQIVLQPSSYNLVMKGVHAWSTIWRGSNCILSHIYLNHVQTRVPVSIHFIDPLWHLIWPAYRGKTQLKPAHTCISCMPKRNTMLEVKQPNLRSACKFLLVFMVTKTSNNIVGA